jgi:hypothetical protein
MPQFSCQVRCPHLPLLRQRLTYVGARRIQEASAGQGQGEWSFRKKS